MGTVEVSVTTPGIDRMIEKISDVQGVSAEIADAWSILYRSFVRLRFAKFAKGGGNWAPLKPATIKRRTQGKKPRAPEILRDTGALFASLQPSVKGGILQERVKQFGMTILLGGGERHARTVTFYESKTSKAGKTTFKKKKLKGVSTGSEPTLSQLAAYHHQGAGRLPKREILVVPDPPTIKKMGDVAARIITRKLKEAK